MVRFFCIIKLMTKNRLLIRMIMLVVVTIIFIISFYFFFKNSRASSPLTNKEYMEQLQAANKQYQTAGKDISELTGQTPPPSIEMKETFFSKILRFFSSFYQ